MSCKFSKNGCGKLRSRLNDTLYFLLYSDKSFYTASVNALNIF